MGYRNVVGFPLMLKTGIIYCLKDVKGNIFYVGSTVSSLENRYKSHLRDSAKSTCPVYVYIRENKIKFTAVEIEKINVYLTYRVRVRESYWIKKFLREGCDLKNHQIKYRCRNIKKEQLEFHPELKKYKK